MASQINSTDLYKGEITHALAEFDPEVNICFPKYKLIEKSSFNRRMLPEAALRQLELIQLIFAGKGKFEPTNRPWLSEKDIRITGASYLIYNVLKNTTFALQRIIETKIDSKEILENSEFEKHYFFTMVRIQRLFPKHMKHYFYPISRRLTAALYETSCELSEPFISPSVRVDFGNAERVREHIAYLMNERPTHVIENLSDKVCYFNFIPLELREEILKFLDTETFGEYKHPTEDQKAFAANDSIAKRKFITFDDLIEHINIIGVPEDPMEKAEFIDKLIIGFRCLNSHYLSIPILSEDDIKRLIYVVSKSPELRSHLHAQHMKLSYDYQLYSSFALLSLGLKPTATQLHKIIEKKELSPFRLDALCMYLPHCEDINAAVSTDTQDTLLDRALLIGNDDFKNAIVELLLANGAVSKHLEFQNTIT